LTSQDRFVGFAFFFSLPPFSGKGRRCPSLENRRILWLDWFLLIPNLNSSHLPFFFFLLFPASSVGDSRSIDVSTYIPCFDSLLFLLLSRSQALTGKGYDRVVEALCIDPNCGHGFFRFFPPLNVSCPSPSFAPRLPLPLILLRDNDRHLSHIKG